MSLVHYDSDSDAESGDEVPPAPARTNPVTGRTSGLFTSLPPPKSSTSSSSVDKEPAKKKKAPIVFTVPVPAKSDSEDEEEVVAPKRAKTGTSGSSLFFMLPAPKSGASNYMTAGKRAEADATGDEANQHSESGHSTAKPVTTASLMPYSLQKKQQGAKKTKTVSDDEDDAADHRASFMKSLSAPNKAAENIAARYSSSQYSSESEPSQVSRPMYGSSAAGNSDDGAIGPYPDYSNEAYDDDVTGEYPVTDDAYDFGAASQQQQSVQYAPVTQRDVHTIQALEGRRGRQDFEGMNIIEVNAAAELGNTAAWRQQFAASQPAAPAVSEASKKHDSNMSGSAKRKHQITYLAAHAKAQQTELEQRWANSRVSKKQGQARYGF